MSDEIRSLLYPLGFLAPLLFSSRTIVQWLYSERLGKSAVPRLFWQLSLIGNLCLFIHSVIQEQLPVALIQAANAVVSWRNLNFMHSSPWRTRSVVLLMTAAIAGTLGLFCTNSLLSGEWDWARTPTAPWQASNAQSLPILWHLFGFIGLTLFASRFWMQWWEAERSGTSILSASFWRASLIGAVISLIYFLRLGDTVNMLGYAIGIIPYLRNLVLLRRPAATACDLWIFAGETSGDLHGGALIEALRRHRPDLRIAGVGGPSMRKAGMETVMPMEKFQIMGFVAVFKSLPRLIRQFLQVRNAILSSSAKAVVLIDFPGFNLRLAKSLRKHGYQGQLIHYVCPTVWAHGKGRMTTLVNTLDKLFCIFPFEPELFSNTSLRADYIGHPLVGHINGHAYDADWRKRYNIPQEARLLALMPGSRKGEIEHHLPTLLKVVGRLQAEFPDLHPVLPVAGETMRGYIEKALAGSPVQPTLIPVQERYNLMHDAHLALAASGTATLELALHEVPTVVVYHVSHLNYFIAKYLVRFKLSHICMANILGGYRTIFPEFPYILFTENNVFTAARRFLVDAHTRRACIAACGEIRTLLGTQDASREAASRILS